MIHEEPTETAAIIPHSPATVIQVVGQLRVVMVSDTHNLHKSLVLPDGDVIVHAGDFSGRGRVEEVAAFLEWYGGLDQYAERLLIAGNHDFLPEREPWLFQAMVPDNVTYLQDSGVDIDGFKFWGSPYTPWFYDWAFNCRGEEIEAHWKKIPLSTDVLITHGPALGILDHVFPHGESVGCPRLSDRIAQVMPKIHVFGHIHESAGSFLDPTTGVRHINASICDRRYHPAHNPTIMTLRRSGA